MRVAISARAISALGATLIACSQVTTVSAEVVVNSVSGITQGSTQGITQGSIQGITQGSVDGITQGSVRGITQGSIRGITQGSVDGITQGSVDGITQGSVRGITQGSIRGITQGSVDGITQGSVDGITQGSIVLAGPVESIDRINGIFTSVGQVVLASQGMLATLRVGDFVSVNGSVVSSGWLYADELSVSSDRYVPGATEIFVTGIPSAVDSLTGRARMGGLEIDYTAALSVGDLPGSAELSFRGIRPNERGLLISDAVSAR